MNAAWKIPVDTRIQAVAAVTDAMKNCRDTTRPDGAEPPHSAGPANSGTSNAI